MDKFIDEFIRRQNIDHFLQLLKTTTDPKERDRLKQLLVQERKSRRMPVMKHPYVSKIDRGQKEPAPGRV